MIACGAVAEVEKLDSASSTCEKAIGISQIRDHLSGLLTIEECVERIAAATRQYAKRQRTWFGKEKWLTTKHMNDHTNLAQLAEHWIRENAI